MTVESEEKPAPSLLDEIRSEAPAFWHHMPDKGLFFALFAVWLLFFHFLGNSVFGYIDTPSLLRWMYHQYDTSPDDEHGLLIPFAVLALLYWKRRELMAVPKRSWWPALGLVGLGLFIHVGGYLIQFPQVSVAGFFLGIYGLTGAIWGAAWMRASFFPMLLLGFCVPLGSLSDAITFPLRLLATQITAWVCAGILGIDVIRDGTQLYDSARRFNYDVAAACGGIRSLIALLCISTIYGFTSFGFNWRRVVVILTAFPLAVAGNVFRLVCIIVASEAFGRDAGSFVHDRLGLLPYIPAIIGLILVGAWLKERPKPSAGKLEAKPA